MFGDRRAHHTDSMIYNHRPFRRYTDNGALELILNHIGRVIGKPIPQLADITAGAHGSLDNCTVFPEHVLSLAVHV